MEPDYVVNDYEPHLALYGKAAVRSDMKRCAAFHYEQLLHRLKESEWLKVCGFCNVNCT